MKKTILALLMVIMAIGIGYAQLPSSFPPKSYPASIMFVVDPGVQQYWDVKRVMYLGPANGGHKFRIYGTGMKDMPSTALDVFYICYDDELQVAGAYYFPEIKTGEAFNFDIVSAFSGYAPSKFIGFMIKDDRFVIHEEKAPANQGKTANAGKTDGSKGVGSNRDAVEKEAQESVEVRASFPGGTSALAQWLSANIRYPEESRKKGVEGRVVVSFTIDKTGQIMFPYIVKGVNAELDLEALRIVSAMPNWNPGTNNGEPVTSYFNLPINFRLTSEKK